MKANIYTLVVIKQDGLGDNLPSPLNTWRSSIRNGLITILSPETVIDYDDLGIEIMNYCSSMPLPSVSDIENVDVAYVQVVPELEGEPLRVYIDAALMSSLSEKGLG